MFDQEFCQDKDKAMPADEINYKARIDCVDFVTSNRYHCKFHQLLS